MGLFVGVVVGRWTMRRDVRRVEPRSHGRRKGSEERIRESVGGEQVRDQILGTMHDGVLLFEGLKDRLRERGPRASSRRAPRDARSGLPTEHRRDHPPRRRTRARGGHGHRDGSAHTLAPRDGHAGGHRRFGPRGDRRCHRGAPLDAVRRDFVANASHELKTPAASIQAAAETLLHVWQEDPAAVPRFAEQLEREAVRLSRIVADLLDLSRLESGSELQENVRLDALVREETSRFEDAAPRRVSRWRSTSPSSPRSVDPGATCRCWSGTSWTTRSAIRGPTERSSPPWRPTTDRSSCA